MTKTVSSATASYLTPAEFLKRTDVRTVGQLCSDTEGVPVSPSALLTDPNLQAALDDAAGEVESAATIGQKYQVADIQLLATTACVARAKLFRIIRDVTIAFLLERRPDFSTDIPRGVEASIERSQAWLEQLAQGTRIFGFLESAQAGTIDENVLTAQEVVNRNGLVVQAERYFGIRADRATLPPPGTLQ